jgi:periplasmic divalent cation tolerance protein
VVQERLAACANIMGPVRSIYRWQGKVETAREVAVIFKTRRAQFDRLAARVKELHTYECPCVVALPIVGGLPAYLDWLAAETAG